LGGRRFILKGLEEKENKRYSSIFIGPRKRPFSKENRKVFWKRKKCVFKKVCMESWKLGETIWERRVNFEKKTSVHVGESIIMS
jgi:hypothetical protein